jgi:hypothetical protein
MIRVRITVWSTILPKEGTLSVGGQDLQVLVAEPIEQAGSKQHLIEDIPQGIHFGV